MNLFNFSCFFTAMTLLGCSSRSIQFQDSRIYRQFDDLEKTLTRPDSLERKEQVFTLTGFPVKIMEQNGAKHTLFSLGKPVYHPGRRTKVGLGGDKPSRGYYNPEAPAIITINAVNSYFVFASELPILSYATNQMEKRPFLYCFKARKSERRMKVLKDEIFDPHTSFFEYATFPETDSLPFFVPLLPSNQFTVAHRGASSAGTSPRDDSPRSDDSPPAVNYASANDFSVPSLPDALNLSVAPIFIAEDNYDLRLPFAQVPLSFESKINLKKTIEFYSKLSGKKPTDGSDSFMPPADIQKMLAWLGGSGR